MIGNTGRVMNWLGLSEGGYVNDPDDPGGPTNHGVTERVWHGWLKMNGRAKSDVRNVTKAVANEIFSAQYLAPVWFDRLPDGLDYAVADFAVNSGPVRAVKELQQSLIKFGQQLAVDGHMGVSTFAAVMAVPDTGLLVAELCNRRLAFMKRLPIWWKYKNGWTRRVMGEETGAQDDDIGVIDRGVRMAHGAKIVGAPKGAPGKATQDPVNDFFALLIKWTLDIIRSYLKGIPA